MELEIIKKHLGVDYDEDDLYIQQLFNVAEESVKVHLNGAIDDMIEYPLPIQQAMLLLTGTMYNNRETIGSKLYSLPHSYDYLLSLYQKY